MFAPGNFLGLLALGFLVALVLVLVRNGGGTAQVINAFGSAYSSSLKAASGQG